MRVRRPWGRPPTCPGPPHILAPPEHARRLASLLRDTREVEQLSGFEEDSHWGQAATWLDMAAGLKEVTIDMSPKDGSGYLCSQAWPYDDAHSKTASIYHTELTRLLYTYCAIENVARALLWPTLLEDGKIEHRIIPHIRNFPVDRLPHYWCIIEHFYWHCANDLILKKMLKKFEISHGRPSVAMQAGIKLRHFLAHGVLRSPAPHHDGESWTDGSTNQTCVARHGASSLLFTTQMLIYNATLEGRLNFLDDHIDLREEMWVADSNGQHDWVFSMPVAEFLFSAHLTAGESPA
ncbi:hypothetical protein Aph01nite_62360 [Acrocarpospora phusangensis]|uniref:Uncharacterized protein n=2 Tax=Acrocarpospora phusangensis TaxID=1070424 RepID=A0A919QFJ5_9ACTN|nr:hypothetical protein Aph01nite_62360 [Acrocarpospora phusangensis]